MIVETIITSAPRGLKAGRTGYQPVMRTRGLRDDVLRQLEPLTGYRHVHRQGSGKNPVNYSYRRLASNVGDLAVLGRTVDAGSDFSNRSNKCGHLIAFTADEIGRLSRSTPAALLADNQALFVSQWTRGPEERPAPPALAVQPQTPAICSTWQSQFGDAGWAAVVAERARRRQPTLLVAPDSSPLSSDLLLRLIREATALLPPADRWAVSFETTVLGASDALIQGTYRGSPEAEATRQGVLVLPLGGPAPPGALQENDLCKLARFGPPKPVAAVPPPVAATAPALPAGDDFLNGPAGLSPSSPPPLLPPTRQPPPGHSAPLTHEKQFPLGTILGASVSFLLVLFLAVWFGWTSLSRARQRTSARNAIIAYADHDHLQNLPGNDDPKQPTKETWQHTGIDFPEGQPTDEWAKRIAIILRLPTVDREIVTNWLEPAEDSGTGGRFANTALALASNPSVDTLKSLEVLRERPPDSISKPLMAFILEAIENGDASLLALANELSVALSKLNDITEQYKKTNKFDPKAIESLANVLAKCSWKTPAGNMTWPANKTLVPGYVKALSAKPLQDLKASDFALIVTNQEKAIASLKNYRKGSPTTEAPGADKYELTLGEKPDKTLLDRLNSYLLTLKKGTPTPSYNELKAAIEKPKPQPKPLPDKRSLAWSRLEKRYAPRADEKSIILADELEDLELLKDLTPEAYRPTNSEDFEGLRFEKVEKKETEPFQIWKANVAGQQVGQLDINFAQKTIRFTPTSDANPLVYLTPIRFRFKDKKTTAKQLDGSDKRIAKETFSGTTKLEEIAGGGAEFPLNTTGNKPGTKQSFLARLMHNADLSTAPEPTKLPIQLRETSNGYEVIFTGGTSKDGTALFNMQILAKNGGLIAATSRKEASELSLVTAKTFSDSKDVKERGQTGKSFFSACVKLLELGDDEDQKKTLERNLIEIFNRHDPIYHMPKPERDAGILKWRWKDAESLISMSRREKSTPDNAAKRIKDRFELGDNDLSYDAGTTAYRPKKLERELLGFENIDAHTARSWEAILAMFLAKTSGVVNDGDAEDQGKKNSTAAEWILGHAKNPEWIQKEVAKVLDKKKTRTSDPGSAAETYGSERRTAAMILHRLRPTIELAKAFNKFKDVPIGSLLSAKISVEFTSKEGDDKQLVPVCRISPERLSSAASQPKSSKTGTASQPTAK